MKNLTFLVLGAIAFIMLLSCVTPPQPLPPEEQVIKQVFEVDKSKDELYRRAMEWMAKTFRSAQHVIQYQDKEEGIIVGKGVIVMNWTFNWPTHFTLTIEVKDGKARAVFSDMYVVVRVEDVERTVPINSEVQLKRFADQGGSEMLTSLEQALKKESEEW